MCEGLNGEYYHGFSTSNGDNDDVDVGVNDANVSNGKQVKRMKGRRVNPIISEEYM